MIKEIVRHNTMKFLVDLWIVILALFIGFNIVSASGGAWQLVGSQGFSPELSNHENVVSWRAIRFDSKDTPYVAFVNYTAVGGASIANKASVMKYDGSSWISVGPTDGFSPGGADFVSLAFDSNDTPHVAFIDHTNGERASVMKFDASSKSWANIGNSGFTAYGVQWTSLAFDSNDTPYVAFQDQYNGNGASVMKYDTSSSTWVSIGNANFSNTDVVYTSLAIDSNDVPYVAFREGFASGYKISVMKYDASSSSWVDVGNRKFSASSTAFLSFDLDPSGTPYVAFQDWSQGGRVTVMQYDASSSSWVNVGNTGFSDGEANFVSLVISSRNIPYVIFDGSTDNRKYGANVMKFDGIKWVKVGKKDFSPGPVDGTSIAVNSKGTIYASFADATKKFKMTVMKYVENWNYAGDVNAISNNGDITSMVSDSHGVKYLAYSDEALNHAATVLQYDENKDTWSVVGAPGLTPGRADDVSLAVDKNDNLYIAFLDDTNRSYYNSSKATVMKFNGTSWNFVGTPGFSMQGVGFVQMVTDNNNTPYVTYIDESISDYVTVMKYNGIRWVNVGGVGLSKTPAGYPSLAFDALNTPYVAFKNMTTDKATVMKYNGTRWVTVGAPNFSLGGVENVSLAMNSNNVPYVSFTDWAKGGRASVMKWTGTLWAPVGQLGFTRVDSNSALVTSLVVHNNVPYVSISYHPEDPNGGTEVMLFNGKNWVTIGNSSFSTWTPEPVWVRDQWVQAGLTWYTDLVVDRWGVPYVSFVEWTDEQKVKVMKFD